jgi:16S rRNA (guanine527-N7)-methyltransferase
VGSTAPEALERHVADSLAAAAFLERGIRVVDLGSGAGFPGIPLAIARPDLSLTLVEIRERRVNFLRHVVRSLELDCEVWRVRIEDAPRLRFRVALARAVAPLDQVLRLAEPWVESGGEIWVWTRESSAGPPGPVAGSIPIPGRGQVLRLDAAAVGRRGTWA